MMDRLCNYTKLRTVAGGGVVTVSRSLARVGLHERFHVRSLISRQVKAASQGIRALVTSNNWRESNVDHRND
jgi:hypothetical protein